MVAEAAACCTSGESREAASARLDPAISGCGIVALRVCEQSPQIMPLGHPVDSTLRVPTCRPNLHRSSSNLSTLQHTT